MYAVGRGDAFATDDMILTPNVLVRRDDRCEWLEEPFRESVITCAAPLAVLNDALEWRIQKVSCARRRADTGALLSGRSDAARLGTTSRQRCRRSRRP